MLKVLGTSLQACALEHRNLPLASSLPPKAPFVRHVRLTPSKPQRVMPGRVAE